MSFKEVSLWIETSTEGWFQRFSTFLFRFGFQQSKYDHSLFINKSADGICLIWCMEMTLIRTGSSSSLLSSLITYLASEFCTKI